MELTKVQLYDAFGELLYAVSKSDGHIQEEEIKKINELLQGHLGEKDIQWSFEYESKKKKTVEEAASKAIDICKHYGPSPEYPFLIDTLKQVAEASNGLEEKEEAIILQFERELKEHFMENQE